MDAIDLCNLSTELRNPASTDLDHMDTADVVHLMNSEDQTVVTAVKTVLNDISRAVDAIVLKFKTAVPPVDEKNDAKATEISADNGVGRLVYVGAGTSGRLGVLDAAELIPTFRVDPSRVCGIIAGGNVAMTTAVEGAEDDTKAAVSDLQAWGLTSRDVVIGIAASGRTPYVIAALQYAHTLGCLTIGVSCVGRGVSRMAQCVDLDFDISPVCGPEVVTGSTRLKAGTCTKMVLNMLSTAVMVRMGKTYGNLMVDLRPTNLKLRVRARNIFRTIVCHPSFCMADGSIGNTACDTDVDKHIVDCNDSLKLAILVAKCGTTVDRANQLLVDSGGVLHDAIVQGTIRCGTADTGNSSAVSLPCSPTSPISSNSSVSDVVPLDTSSSYVLCVDGGGSRTRVVLSNGAHYVTIETGPSNISSADRLESCIDTVADGIDKAVIELSRIIPSSSDVSAATNGSKSLILPIALADVWVAIAGVGSLSATQFDAAHKLLCARLARHSSLAVRSTRIRLTTDAMLLTSVLLATTYFSQKHSCICVIAGTGSSSMVYDYDVRTREYVLRARSGGFGPLLGDEGAGYAIGLQVAKDTMRAVQARALKRHLIGDNVSDDNRLTPLHHSVINHFGTSEDLFMSKMIALSKDPSRIASITSLVFSLAFEHGDGQSLEILQQAASALVQSTIMPYIACPDSQAAVSDMVLVTGGSLLCNANYRSLVLGELARLGIAFADVHRVHNPSETAAMSLLKLKS